MPQTPKSVKRILLAASLLVLVGLVSMSAAQPASNEGEAPVGRPGIDFIELFNLNDRLEPLYADIQSIWDEQGFQRAEGVRIEIPGAAFVEYRGETEPVIVDSYEGETGSIFLWEEEESTVVYEVDVPAKGLYWIGIEYYSMPGKRASAMRDIKINGVYPFNEARRLQFERVWRDANLPKQDNQGNDIRPIQIETPEWQFKWVEDSDTMYRYPFLWPLDEGVNRIEIRSIREPMAVKTLVIAAPERLPTYAEVLAEYRAKGYQEVKDVIVKFQAETPVKKSDPTVRAEFGTDPLMDPPSEGFWRLNEFGSWRWRKGGQWAEWKFTITEPGLYKIGIKAWQGFQRWPSVREIRINGKIPFQELEEYEFHYDRYWRMEELADENGNPYLFYFEPGEHTISMRVKVGRAADTIRLLELTTKELAGIGRAITYLTGPNPDPYMEYEVHKQIPELLPKLQEIRDRLRNHAEELRAWTNTRVDLAELMRLTADQLDTMIRDPYRIHTRIDEFAEMQSRLSFYILELRYGPIALDYFMVASPDAQWPRVKANVWERFWYEVEGFVESFYKDYAGVGNIYDDDEALEVWVAWGREWAMIVKEMIEEDFTPKTGIRVNVNVIPRSAVHAQSASVILLAAASGNAPDLVMGADAQLPVEFAIRGGVVDLSQFDDFEEVLDRFRPGMLTPYTYRGGVYALPETQSFNMMFYRIDIMEEIAKETGIMEPQTWQEVLEILPSLQQRGMNFYYPSPTQTVSSQSFAPFLYQYGGDFYTEDGLRSALDTPEALQAFRLWTDLYANFKLDIEANFYNRMRTGEIPIGVADYYNYVLLSTAAPELTGWWRMVPLPGIRKPDGTIDRSAGGTSTATVVFKDSKRPYEAWQLAKWWTSTEVQTRYAEELEALLGVEAKWNTANVQAFNNLPWPRQDIEAIQAQWEWFREKPVVLGDYFTPRHITNAWNSVVLEGRNPREALEKAVEDINRELIRKQEEFGIEIPEELKRDLYRGRQRVSPVTIP